MTHRKSRWQLIPRWESKIFKTQHLLPLRTVSRIILRPLNTHCCDVCVT